MRERVYCSGIDNGYIRDMSGTKDVMGSEEFLGREGRTTNIVDSRSIHYFYLNLLNPEETRTLTEGPIKGLYGREMRDETSQSKIL